MSVPYVCTQCGQTFRVGAGAGVALDCLACGGLSLPSQASDAPELYEEEDDPGMRARPAPAAVPARPAHGGLARDDASGEGAEGGEVRGEDAGEDAGEEEGEDLHKLPTAILDQATEVLRVPDEATPLAGLSLGADAREDSFLFAWPGDGEDEGLGLDGAQAKGPSPLDEAREGLDDETFDDDVEAGAELNPTAPAEDAPSSPSLPASLLQHLAEATPGPRPAPAVPGEAASDDDLDEDEQPTEAFSLPEEPGPPSALGHGLPLRERSSPGLHLVLSEEAQQMAGVRPGGRAVTEAPPPARRVIPLGAAAAPSSARGEGPSAAPNEPGVPGAPPAPPAPPLARDASATQRVARAASPHLRGGPARILGGAALASACVGLLWGLWTGGPDAALAATPRGRAEDHMSEGNRAFAEARYDDALGHYRESWVQDRAYAPALRAKAVTLAKLQRHAEAAAAYRQYLEAEPAAPDAPEVREVLTRFAGAAGP